MFTNYILKFRNTVYMYIFIAFKGVDSNLEVFFFFNV